MEDFANNVDEAINIDTKNFPLDKESNSQSSRRCC